MADGKALLVALGGFGLGISAALTLALLASRQVLEFLATFNAWALRGIAGMAGRDLNSNDSYFY